MLERRLYSRALCPNGLPSLIRRIGTGCCACTTLRSPWQTPIPRSWGVLAGTVLLPTGLLTRTFPVSSILRLRTTTRRFRCSFRAGFLFFRSASTATTATYWARCTIRHTIRTRLPRTGGLDVNYLGDPGGSGNFFGNPIFFQVVDRTAANSPSGGTIILGFGRDDYHGTGLNSPVGLLVEGFSDTAFDETLRNL